MIIRDFQQTLDSLLTEIGRLSDAHLSKRAPAYLEYLVMRARTWTNQGEYDRAMQAYDTVIVAAKEDDETKKMGLEAMANKGFLLLLLGQVKKGMALADTTINLLEMQSPIDTFSMILAHQVISYGADYLHEYQKALKYSNIDLHFIKEKFGHLHPNVGITYMQIGGIHKEMANYPLAIKFYQKAKKILLHHYEQTGNVRHITPLLGNMALMYSGMGEIDLALEYMEEAERIDRNSADKMRLSHLWHLNGVLEMLLKNERFAEADSVNRLCLQLLDANPQALPHQYLTVASYQLDIDYGLGRWDKVVHDGKSIYRKLNRIKDKSPKDLPYVSSIIIKALEDLNRREDALKWTRILEKETRAYYTKGHPEITLAMNDALEIYGKIGDYKLAKTTLERILKESSRENGELSFRHVVPNSELITTAEIWSEILEKQIEDGNIPVTQMDDFLKDFTVYFGNHLSLVLSNTRLSDDIRALKHIFAPAIRIHLNKAPQKALLYVEQVKSLLTRLLLQNRLVKDPEMRAFSSSWWEEGEGVSDFVHASDALEHFNQYKDSLRVADPEAYRERYGIPDFSMDKIRALIPESGGLLEYFKSDTTLYIFRLTQGDIQTHSVDYSKVELALTTYLKDKNRVHADTLAALILPGEGMGDLRDWVIFPDDKLYYLNFEALYDLKGDFLLKHKCIRYGLSAGVLDQQIQLDTETVVTRGILGFTPGFLPELKQQYMKRDSIQIDSSWMYFLQQPFLVRLAHHLGEQGNTISLIGPVATEHRFKMQEPDFAIVHLGTHGVLNDRSPLFSKLIFAKDSLEDAYLYTYEIFKQVLHTKLAVLSACNTGSGAISSGNSVFSIANAFTHAGCPATLMTLWEVDEESTAKILTSFYAYLRQGLPKSRALRRAKLDFLNAAAPRFRRPYYWAGLVLMGSDAPVFTASAPVPRYLLWGLGAILVVLLLLFLRRQIARR